MSSTPLRRRPLALPPLFLLAACRCTAAAGAPWLPPLAVGRAAPPRGALDGFAARSGSTPLARYPGSTASSSSLPRGWLINRSTRRIGSGRSDFGRASCALGRLDCLELGWLTRSLQGDVLVIGSRQLGCVWLLLANRVLRRETSARVRAVTWGTTRHHVLVGEEQLSVRWDAPSDAVVFEVLSFSRPRHWLAWLSYPLVVAQQKRFARDATAAMVQACAT